MYTVVVQFTMLCGLYLLGKLEIVITQTTGWIFTNKKTANLLKIPSLLWCSAVSLGKQFDILEDCSAVIFMVTSLHDHEGVRAMLLQTTGNYVLSNVA